MPSAVIRIIITVFRFVMELVLDIVCAALLLVGLVGFWRWPFLPEFDQSSSSARVRFRFFALACLGTTLLDIITLPVAIVTTFTWRTVRLWKKVLSTPTAEFYVGERRYFVWEQFALCILDLFFIAMIGLIHCTCWRLYFFYPAVLKEIGRNGIPLFRGRGTQNQGHSHSQFREIILFNAANGFLDLFLLPMALVVLVTGYRVQVAWNEWETLRQTHRQALSSNPTTTTNTSRGLQSATNILKQKRVLFKHFLLIFVDLPFGVMYVITLACLIRSSALVEDFRAKDTAGERRKLIACHFLFTLRDVLCVPLMIPLFCSVYRGFFATKSIIDTTRKWARTKPDLQIVRAELELPTANRNTGIRLHVKAMKDENFALVSVEKGFSNVRLFVRNAAFWNEVESQFGATAGAFGQTMLPLTVTPKYFDITQLKQGTTEADLLIDFNINVSCRTLLKNAKKLRNATIDCQLEYGSSSGTLFALRLNMAHFEEYLRDEEKARAVLSIPVVDLEAVYTEEERSGKRFCDCFALIVTKEFALLLIDIVALVFFILLHLFPHRIWNVYTSAFEKSCHKKARKLKELMVSTLSPLIVTGGPNSYSKTIFQIDTAIRTAFAGPPESLFEADHPPANNNRRSQQLSRRSRPKAYASIVDDFYQRMFMRSGGVSFRSGWSPRRYGVWQLGPPNIVPKVDLFPPDALNSFDNTLLQNIETLEELDVGPAAADTIATMWEYRRMFLLACVQYYRVIEDHFGDCTNKRIVTFQAVRELYIKTQKQHTRLSDESKHGPRKGSRREHNDNDSELERDLNEAILRSLNDSGGGGRKDQPQRNISLRKKQRMKEEGTVTSHDVLQTLLSPPTTDSGEEPPPDDGQLLMMMSSGGCLPGQLQEGLQECATRIDRKLSTIAHLKLDPLLQQDRTGGKEGWGGFRATVYHEVSQLMYDVAAALCFLIAFCSVYRTYSLLRLVFTQMPHCKRKACLLSAAEIGVDLLYFIKVLFVLMGVRGIVSLPTDLLIYCVFQRKPSFAVARQIIDQHVAALATDIVHMLSLVFAWDTLRLVLATVVFGIFSPGVMLEGAISAWAVDDQTGRASVLNKSTVRAGVLLLFSIAWMFGLPFIIGYYANGTTHHHHNHSNDERNDDDDSTVFPMMGAIIYISILLSVLWLGVIVALVWIDSRVVSIRRGVVRYLQPTWQNTGVMLVVLLEAFQLLALVFAAVTSVKGIDGTYYASILGSIEATDAVREVSRYAFLIFGSSWTSGGIPFGVYFSLSSALLFFIVSALPIVTDDMLHWRSGKHVIRSPAWIGLFQFLGHTCLLTVVRNLTLVLMCVVSLPPSVGEEGEGFLLYTDGRTQCWTSTDHHRGIAIASMIALIYYVPSAVMRNLKYDESICKGLDVVYPQLYKMLIHSATLTTTSVTLMLIGSSEGYTVSEEGSRHRAVAALAIVLGCMLWCLFWTLRYGSMLNSTEGVCCSVQSMTRHRLCMYVSIAIISLLAIIAVSTTSSSSSSAEWLLYTTLAVLVGALATTLVFTWRNLYGTGRDREPEEDSIEEIRTVLLRTEEWLLFHRGGGGGGADEDCGTTTADDNACCPPRQHGPLNPTLPPSPPSIQRSSRGGGKELLRTEQWLHRRALWRNRVRSAMRASQLSVLLAELESHVYVVYLSPSYLNSRPSWCYRVWETVDDIDKDLFKEIDYEMESYHFITAVLCCTCCEGVNSHSQRHWSGDDDDEDDYVLPPDPLQEQKRIEEVLDVATGLQNGISEEEVLGKTTTKNTLVATRGKASNESKHLCEEEKQKQGRRELRMIMIR